LSAFGLKSARNDIMAPGDPPWDGLLLGRGVLLPTPAHLGKTGPLSQGVKARRKALRILCMNGMEVRKKRPRGFKKRPRGFKRAP
jgi:hypothetical protein